MAGRTQTGAWSESPAPIEATQQTKWFSWSGLLSPQGLAGIVDAGVVLLYMGGLQVGFGLSRKLELWYAFMTVIKLAALAVSWNQRSPLSGPAKWLIGSTATMVLATTATGFGGFSPYLAVAAFLVNLALSSMLVSKATLNRYLVGPVFLIAGSALIHIFLCLTHRIPTWFGGRYFYFGGNQFNLGGEIEAVGCLAAVLLLPRLMALPVLGILLYDMSLMQTRSALLVGVACLATLVVFDGSRRLNPGRATALFFLVPIMGLLLVSTGLGGKLGDSISGVLLLNDAHRGIASGGSGRQDLWDWSIQLFQDSPIVGHDLSYFESIGFIGSHNIFLYGLAQYGLMSLLFFGSIIYAYTLLLIRDRHRFVVMLCALPLLLFNDRFTSLNPYPFIFFVLLIAGAAREPPEPAQS